MFVGRHEGQVREEKHVPQLIRKVLSVRKLSGVHCGWRGKIKVVLLFSSGGGSQGMGGEAGFLSLEAHQRS